MKKLSKLFFLVGMMAFVLAGCKKEVEVSLSKSSVSIAAEGDTMEVTLSSNGDWQVSGTAEWLTVSPLTGNGDAILTLVAQPNPDTVARTATLEVTTKDQSATLEVTQKALSHFISVAPTEIVCGNEGGEFTVEVGANIDWTVSDLPDWVSCTPLSGSGTGTLTLGIASLVGQRPRQATIKVGSDTLSATLDITQNTQSSQEISVSPDRVDFEYGGGSQTLTLQCSGSWTVQIERDWVTLSATSGQGDAEIQLSAAENPDYSERSSSLLFVSEYGTEARVKIIQAAAPNPNYLNVTPEEKTMESDGGSFDVNVESDIEWQANTSAEWVILSQGQGSGNGTFSVEVAPNMLFTPRVAHITIAGDNLSKTVIVHQEGAGQVPFVHLSPNALDIAQYGGVATLTIEANVAWRLEASPWITLLAPTGVANGSCGVAIDANNTYATRTGFIRAYYNNALMDEIEVTQEGLVVTLEVSPTEISATAESSKYPVSITADQEWTATTTASWIALEPRPGDGTLIIAVMDNTTSSPRTAEVRVLGAQHGVVTITVNQAAN